MMASKCQCKKDYIGLRCEYNGKYFSARLIAAYYISIVYSMSLDYTHEIYF